MIHDLAIEVLPLTKEQILSDYRLACESRQCSLLVRKEVFSGRAKFGVYGDGKELAQIALARVFRAGDFRSGYYRDQTFVVAVGDMTWTQFFAQLYGNADILFEPHSGGRMMNGHYATRWLDDKGHWQNQSEMYNSAGDISPTAGQIPRSIGLGYASKLFRNLPDLHPFKQFSTNGNEVCFATIGDASTSQGMFFEAINAAGVLQIPVVFSVWDDGYGISVPTKYQTTKESISKILAGFQRNEQEAGLEIFTPKGWDYIGLLENYHRAATLARENHVPSLVHVQEITQQQGHSSSGSHERYKSKERLEWEMKMDCNRHFRQWILENGYATNAELESIEQEAKNIAKQARDEAWNNYWDLMKPDFDKTCLLLQTLARQSQSSDNILEVLNHLKQTHNPIRHHVVIAIKQALRVVRFEESKAKQTLIEWLEKLNKNNKQRFSSFLYSVSNESPLLVTGVIPAYNTDAPMIDGRDIINQGFDSILKQDPRVYVIGEDVGDIGDVNQTLHGLQEKYGALRVTDTGIRETTIVGQGIGGAMRGLRPIIEIQYFDYIYYALATLTDDLACLHYRTVGGQKAPLIVRTRGHRLEGVWHSGSPMAVVLNSLRGLHICVPRNMTQAVGFYNTLLAGDDPALIVECLNGYRLKERQPNNLANIRVPLGVPEILLEGNDITIITYGAMCRIVMNAAEQLQKVGIFCEVIDVQTLIPFDIHKYILNSVKKTSRILITDEDMPGGATGFMLQQLMDEQKIWQWLDASPRTLAAMAHRPAFTSDGDYFSKPNADDVFDAVYNILHEALPNRFPAIN